MINAGMHIVKHKSSTGSAVRDLHYCLKGCEFKSQYHQADTAEPLNQDP